MPTHPNNTENGIAGLVINLHNEILEASRLAFETKEVSLGCEITSQGMILAVSCDGRIFTSVLLSGSFENCLADLGIEIADVLEDETIGRHDEFLANIENSLEEIRNMASVSKVPLDELRAVLTDIVSSAKDLEQNIDEDLFNEIAARRLQTNVLRRAIDQVLHFGKIHVDAPSPKFIMHGSLATVTTAVDPVVEAARREVNHPANFDIYGFDGGIDPVGR